ncbi:hypothetical protein Tdes44962_MAKER06520 [Teratosphaeria destructans]|uniref:Uncharacterized protein n=1 Tax=Teratosphaeria destructans TaxID=418781 RepID=A0A9W7W7U1_9PEZI|nr:hypothetical protein Tdes44962_MAKER06520 [Teratosphaeria destructans]
MSIDVDKERNLEAFFDTLDLDDSCGPRFGPPRTLLSRVIIIRAGTVSQSSVPESQNDAARYAEFAKVNQEIFSVQLGDALYELQQSLKLPKCLTGDAFALAASPDGLTEADREVAATIAEEIRALGSTPPSDAPFPNTTFTPPSSSPPTNQAAGAQTEDGANDIAHQEREHRIQAAFSKV